jgi:CheY-like chemotaxis protein
MDRPITRLSVFASLVRATRAEGPSLRTQPSASSKKKSRVLVIDDEPGMRRVFSRSLRGAGFDVVIAADGPDGLDKLRNDASIGLVLLDLNMPGMDGWQFRDEQRADPQLRDVPTVVVTGEPMGRIISEPLHASQYLLKPVGLDHLISVVAEYCAPRAW